MLTLTFHSSRSFRVAASCLNIALASSSLAQTPTTTVPSPPSATHHLIGVRTRLERSLDAKKLKEGDPVIARPEVKVHVADGLDLQPNSLLIGRVDKVEPSINGGDSAIAITFYKAHLKGANEIPIKATILWIGEPPSMLNPKVVSAPADRTTPGVGVEAGNSQVPPAQGYQGSEITGAPAHSDPAATSGNAANLPVGVAWQINAIAGVNFSSDIGRLDSGWFRSKKKNVSVPAGTVFAIAIMALPVDGATP
jgi:hypothetical protein